MAESNKMKEMPNKMKEMPVNKLMVQMGIPMILSMALQAVYNIVDSAFVGNMKSGSEAALNALKMCIRDRYQPVIVADCVSSRKELDKELGLKRAEQEGILITSKEAILFELTRKAGGPVFKQISALIK